MSNDPAATARRRSVFQMIGAAGILLMAVVLLRQIRWGKPIGQGSVFDFRGAVWDYLYAAGFLLQGVGLLGGATGRWLRLIGAVGVAIAVLVAVLMTWG